MTFCWEAVKINAEVRAILVHSAPHPYGKSRRPFAPLIRWSLSPGKKHELGTVLTRGPLPLLTDLIITADSTACLQRETWHAPLST